MVIVQHRVLHNLYTRILCDLANLYLYFDTCGEQGSSLSCFFLYSRTSRRLRIIFQIIEAHHRSTSSALQAR